MKSFWGGDDDKSKSGASSSVSSSMFSYFSGGSTQQQQPQQQQNRPAPTQHQPPPQQQQSRQVDGNRAQQQPQQGQQNAGVAPSSSSGPATSSPTIPLKIQLSSPSLAINVPILCHGYGNQEGVFSWYRISPVNAFHLVATTLQPSYTPGIDDANNIIVCQFKPDCGVPSEYARIGPIRLASDLAHSVVRLMQNKHFINTPVTYLHTKGSENVKTMEKWLNLMEECQKLEILKNTDIQRQLSMLEHKVKRAVEAHRTGNYGTKNKNKKNNNNNNSDDDDDDAIDPDFIPEINMNSMDSDRRLQQIHQELHELIIADAFNPIIRTCPVQNAMEPFNIKHASKYVMTLPDINNNTVTSPNQTQTTPNATGNTPSNNTAPPQQQQQQIQVPIFELKFTPPLDEMDYYYNNKDESSDEEEEEDDDNDQDEDDDNEEEEESPDDEDDEGANSEDEQHASIHNNKNKSSMGDLLSFLSTGLGASGGSNLDARTTSSLQRRLSRSGGSFIRNNSSRISKDGSNVNNLQPHKEQDDDEDGDDDNTSDDDTGIISTVIIKTTSKEKVGIATTTTASSSNNDSKTSVDNNNDKVSTDDSTTPVQPPTIIAPQQTSLKKNENKNNNNVEQEIKEKKHVTIGGETVPKNATDNKDQVNTPIKPRKTSISLNASSTSSLSKKQKRQIKKEKTIRKNKVLDNLMFNSHQIPNIPLNNAVIFTPRNDLIINNHILNSEKTKKEDDDNNNPGQTVTFPASHLLFILDTRTYFIYTFCFEQDGLRDQYALALRAISEKLHPKRPITQASAPQTSGIGITTGGSANNNNNLSSALNNNGNNNNNNIQGSSLAASQMTSVIPPAPIFKSWLPYQLQQKYRIHAPTSLIQSLNVENLKQLNDLNSNQHQQNYFSNLDPQLVIDNIAHSTWFKELHAHIPIQQQQQQQQSYPVVNPTTGGLSLNNNNSNNNKKDKEADNNNDNILPDVQLLFKVYQHDQDTLIHILQEKMNYLYQRNNKHKNMISLLSKQNSLNQLDCEIYKEKYYNERLYNDELINNIQQLQTYNIQNNTPNNNNNNSAIINNDRRNSTTPANNTTDGINNNNNGSGLLAAKQSLQNTEQILTRQMFRQQQHQQLVKSSSILSDTRGIDISGGGKNNSSGDKADSSSGDNKNTSTTTTGGKDIATLQDQIIQQQQIIQQLKKDNKQLITSNMMYKEHASLTNEYEMEVKRLKEINTQLTNKITKMSLESTSSSSSTSSSLLSSASNLMGLTSSSNKDKNKDHNNNNKEDKDMIVDGSSSHGDVSNFAVGTLQKQIQHLTEKVSKQHEEVLTKDRKIVGLEQAVAKLDQQLAAAYKQQQDLIQKGIEQEHKKLQEFLKNKDIDINNNKNYIDSLLYEINLYKTQLTILESLNIQQHVEMETLETTIDGLQSNIINLIKENDYLKQQQSLFITLQSQYKQQQAQLLLLQHENVTLSNTIVEHQQHIVNLQQQKTLIRNQSIIPTSLGGKGGNNSGDMQQQQQMLQLLQRQGISLNPNNANGNMMMNNNQMYNEQNEKMTNLTSELQYYKQKCFSLSTSLERLMRKHHQEMMTGGGGKNQKGNNNNNVENSTLSIPNNNNTGNVLIDPLNDKEDQELLYKIYTTQQLYHDPDITKDVIIKEYYNIIKQIELLIETNKLLRFDYKQIKLQYNALSQQYNIYKQTHTTPTSSSSASSHHTSLQVMQNDLLSKQLQETKNLVTTLTFVLQDKQQHIELIKTTNKTLCYELQNVKKQMTMLYQQQQEQLQLLTLQAMAQGNVNHQGNNNQTATTAANGVMSPLQQQQQFYF